MARDTPTHYRNLVLYEIYVRNHGSNGTFADVEADLPRIRDLGVDVVWFMPIHPIGALNKKGALGCPYSIADYRAVNPAYGTMDDWLCLVRRAHALGMKVMIDVVYNHTAHDAVLVRARPDWYHPDAQGRPMTTVPEWSDVIDLRHPNPALSAYLIETLCSWAKQGVDGFRCDVAPLLPISFWEEARAAVAEVKPGVIWLAETVHAGWVEDRRSRGLPCLSDSEVYAAFDMTYDYEIWAAWQAVVRGDLPVERYLELLRLQRCIYPTNYIKMRCVENHDNARIMAFAPSRAQAVAWTAFQAFNEGPFLIYGGQESGATHTPSLFELDQVSWGDYSLQSLLTRLCRLKKDPAQMNGRLALMSGMPAIQAAWHSADGGLYGVFNVHGVEGSLPVGLPDGAYVDLLSGERVAVHGGRAAMPISAWIVRYAGGDAPHDMYCPLLDYHPDLTPSGA